MSYYNFCGIGSQHSNISKGIGEGGIHIKITGMQDYKFKFGAKFISDNFYVYVPESFLFLYFKY
jgi:hypothetical protein